MKNTLNLLLMGTANGKNVNNYLKEYLLDFEKKEDISVNFNFISWNRAYETIINLFKEGNPPDVFQLGTTWVRTMTYLDYISPLNISIKTNPPLSDWMNKYCNYQGEQIAAPWLVDTFTMVARQDILDKYDISADEFRDQEGFRRVCSYLTDLHKKKKAIKALSLTIRPDTSTIHYFSSLLFAAGRDFPDLYSVPDKILLRKEFVEVFDYIYSLLKTCDMSIEDVDKHRYELDYQYYYHNGSVFYIGNWNKVIENIVHGGIENNQGYSFTPYPIPSKGANESTYGGGSVLTVSSRSNYPEKSWKLIEFMTGSDFLNKWQKITSGVPAFDYEFWQRRSTDKSVKTLYEMTVNSKSYPLHPIWTSIEDRLGTAISNSLWKIVEDINIDRESSHIEVLRKHDREINDLLKMAWEMNRDEH
ncbi:MAG: extracellular solute-binding protein [bacterium]